MDLNHLKQKHNVYYLTPEDTKFSEYYIAVREKENRVLSDNDVRKLPYLKRNEWLLREKSTERILNYISKKSNTLNLLDIGCGNGWFTNKMAEISKRNRIIGIDVNSLELEQASRVFKTKNINFVYADIFKATTFFEAQFDIITLNGSIQYFKDLPLLKSHLYSFLKPKGEIHILDSPFYNASQIAQAKKRTADYYSQIGIPNMAANYYHHDEKYIAEFEMLYTAKRSIFHRFLNRKDSPFSWYRFRKI